MLHALRKEHRVGEDGAVRAAGESVQIIDSRGLADLIPCSGVKCLSAEANSFCLVV